MELIGINNNTLYNNKAWCIDRLMKYKHCSNKEDKLDASSDFPTAVVASQQTCPFRPTILKHT